MLHSRVTTVFLDTNVPRTGIIQSLQRGLRVLEFLGASGGSVHAKQVAQGLDLNLSTAYHLLNTLVLEGYVQRSTGCGYSVVGVGTSADRAKLPSRGNSARRERALGRAAFAIDDTAFVAQIQDECWVNYDQVFAVPGVLRNHTLRAAQRERIDSCVSGVAIAAVAPPATLANLIKQAGDCAETDGDLFSGEQFEEAISGARDRGYSVLKTNGVLMAASAVEGPRSDSLRAVGLMLPARRAETDPSRWKRALSHLVRRYAAASAER
jgi:DNA-binding IclR family transcriptional regulator